MSTVRADNYGNRTGTSQIPAETLLQGTAKAWFNLNGTGTIAARDSFNVSSFVDNGTGDYTSNFAISMPNALYGFTTCGELNRIINRTADNQMTGSLRYGAYLSSTAALTDSPLACSTIIGDPV